MPILTADTPSAELIVDNDSLQADFFYGDEQYELEFDEVQSQRVLEWIARHVEIASTELAAASKHTPSAFAPSESTEPAGEEFDDDFDENDDSDDEQ